MCVHRWNAPRADLVCYHLPTIVPNRDLGGNDGPEEGRAYITGSVDGELLRGSE